METGDERVRHAVALAEAGKTEEARAELVTLVKTDQDNVAAWAALAQLADVPRDAAYCLKQVLRIQPDNEWARMHLQRLSQQEASSEQTPQAAHETVQQSPLPQTGSSPHVPIKLALGAGAVLAILMLLGGLAIIRGGAAPFSQAPGDATLPASTRLQPTSPSGPIATPRTDAAPANPLPISTGAAATLQVTGSTVSTGTQTPRTTTATPVPWLTPSPTEMQVLTPTDYPTATDPPQPPDAPTDQPPATPGPCDCYGGSLTCGDFDTQVQAQACYDYCLEETGMDIYHLDTNQNDVACEGLP